MNFLEKLDMMMGKYGFSKKSLSQHSGIPYTTIDAWYKKGYEGLKLTTLRKLSDFFNTSLDFWVLDEIVDPNYGKSHGFIVEYSEMRFIEKYRSLPASSKAHVDDVLRWELEHAAQMRRLEKEFVSKSQQPAAGADPNGAGESSSISSAAERKADFPERFGENRSEQVEKRSKVSVRASASDLDPDAAAQDLRDHADRKMRLVQEKKA